MKYVAAIIGTTEIFPSALNGPGPAVLDASEDARLNAAPLQNAVDFHQAASNRICA
jgi:hypothetical protein